MPADCGPCLTGLALWMRLPGADRRPPTRGRPRTTPPVDVLAVAAQFIEHLERRAIPTPKGLLPPEWLQAASQHRPGDAHPQLEALWRAVEAMARRGIPRGVRPYLLLDAMRAAPLGSERLPRLRIAARRYARCEVMWSRLARRSPVDALMLCEPSLAWWLRWSVTESVVRDPGRLPGHPSYGVRHHEIAEQVERAIQHAPRPARFRRLISTAVEQLRRRAQTMLVSEPDRLPGWVELRTW